MRTGAAARKAAAPVVRLFVKNLKRASALKGEPKLCPPAGDGIKGQQTPV